MSRFVVFTVMTTSANPFNELARTFKRMQEEFESVARNWNQEEFELPTTATSPVKVDVEETDEALVVTAELPGFETDDMDLRVNEQTLHIQAEREEEEEAEEGEYVRRERHRASVTRSVALPEAVETEGIEASYDNGVLTVRLPKSEPVTEGTEIEVN